MKYFVITIGRGSSGMIYPLNYQSQIGDFAKDHLYYKVGDVDMLLLCINDINATNIARKDVVEITEAEAKAISEVNEKRTETITDEAKIRRIELKVRMGKPLAKEDLAAIDPANSTSGFETSKILADRIEDLKLNETIK